ncbi:MAG: RNA methyltransferase [Oscillospiraceae bacterium]|nr:RNA methyltransferase [Oscillospiraceae bacterium]
MEIINSKDNLTIKRIRKLIQSKKERLKYKQFVIEGHKLIEEALKSQIQIEICLFTDSFLTQYQSFVENLTSRATRMQRLAPGLESRISVNSSPQSIYCVCSLPDFSVHHHNLQPGKHLALIQIQDPHNLGAIIRTADAFSIDCLYISSDSVDLFCPKVIRASMGSCFRQKVTILNDVYTFLNICKTQKFATYATTVEGNTQDITQIQFSKNSVIFIGNEGNGLPKELISSVEHHIKIPISSQVDSLNVSVATGILACYLTNSTPNFTP